ncbi:hypothetical protein pb186bvf_008650 [Paramecium bursaria]
MGICFEKEIPKFEQQIPEVVLQHQLHNITLQITRGNLVDETTDAILTITDINLNIMSHRYTREIIKQAGKTTQEDLLMHYRARKNIEYGDVIYTHSGELDFDYLFFAFLPPQFQIDSDHIYKRKMKSFIEESQDSFQQQVQQAQAHDTKRFIEVFIHKTLKLVFISLIIKCNSLGLQSISFPLIYSDNFTSGKVFPVLVILVAIKQYLDEHHTSIKTLQTIHITVADSDYLKPFKHAFQKLFDGKPSDCFDTPLIIPEQQEVSDENEIIHFGNFYTSNIKRPLKNNRVMDSI